MLPIRELADEGSIRRNELEKPTLLHDANTNIVCVSHEDQPARLGYDSKRKHETKGPPVPLFSFDFSKLPFLWDVLCIHHYLA